MVVNKYAKYRQPEVPTPQEEPQEPVRTNKYARFRASEPATSAEQPLTQPAPRPAPFVPERDNAPGMAAMIRKDYTGSVPEQPRLFKRPAPVMLPDELRALEAEKAREAARVAARKDSAHSFGGGMEIMPTEDAGGNVRPGTDVDTDISKGIVTAPIQFGQGLGEGVANVANVVSAASTGLYNAGANLVDPGREQAQPWTLEFPRNAFLENEGASVSGMAPRIAGQVMSARFPIGKAMPGGGFGAEVAKDSMAFGLSTPQDAPRLSDMIDPNTPVIGGVADFLASNPTDNAFTAFGKNAAEDALIGGGIGAILRGGVKALDVVGSGAQTNALANPRNAPRAGPSPNSMFSSKADYSVATQDSGTFGVSFNRTDDGGAVIFHDKGTIEYKPEFAKGKSDEELLAYTFEPLGFEGATKGGSPPTTSGPPAGPAPFSASPEPTRRNSLASNLVTRNADRIAGGAVGASLGGVGDAYAAPGDGGGDGLPVGAGMGAAIGIFGPRALATAGSRGYRAAARVARPAAARGGFDERIAAKAVRDALKSGGINSAADASAAFTSRFGDKPASVADLTQDGVGTAAGISRLPGATGEAARARGEDLLQNRAGRLERDIAGATGASPATISGDVERMMRLAQEQATPAYDALRAEYGVGSLASGRLNQLRELDAIRPHIQAVESYQDTLATTQGRAVGDFEFWDLVKRDIDAKEQQLIAAGATMDDIRLRRLEDTRTAIVRELDALIPDYAAARQLGGEAPRMRDAFREGQGLLGGRYTTEDVSRVVEGVTGQQLTAMQAGVIRSMVGKAEGSRNTIAALTSTGAHRKLTEVFGPQAADQMRARFLADGAIVNNAHRINPNVGSVTSQAQLGGGLGPLLAEGIRAVRNPAEAALAALSRSGSYSKAQRDRMGEMLLGGATPENLARIFPQSRTRNRRGPPNALAGPQSTGPQPPAPTSPQGQTPNALSTPPRPPVKAGFGGSSKPLPMDEASRMGRAREQGFDVETPLYHGTAGDVEAFDFEDIANMDFDTGSGVFLTRSPSEAGYFTKTQTDSMGSRSNEYVENANIMPVYARLRNPVVFETQADFRAAVADTSYDRRGHGYGFKRDMEALGHDGVIVRNSQMDGQDGAEWRIIFDPKNIRGKFAKFDPAEAGSSKLLAGIGGSEGVGGFGGAVAGGALAPDANNDGVVDAQERAAGAFGGALSGIVGAKAVRAGGNALAKVGKAPSVERGPVRFGGKTDGGGPPSVRYGAGKANSEPTPRQSITLATTKGDNGKPITVKGEAFNDRGRMVLSPEWPTNAFDELEKARQKAAMDSAFPPKPGPKLVDENYGKPPKPRSEWEVENPKAAEEIGRKVAERFVGLMNADPSPVHVLALKEGVDIQSIGNIIEGGLPKNRQIWIAKDGGEIAVVDKAWHRQNPQEYTTERWNRMWPSSVTREGRRYGWQEGRPFIFADEAPNPPPAQAGFSFGGKGPSKPPANALADPAPKGPPARKPAPPQSRAEQEARAALKKARTAHTNARRQNVMRDNRDELNRPLELAEIEAGERLQRVLDNDARFNTLKARGKEIIESPDVSVPLKYGLGGAAIGSTAILGYNALMPKERGERPMSPRDPQFYWTTVVADKDKMVPVQLALKAWGEWPADTDATGLYGKVTKAALRAWRYDRGLDPEAPMTKEDTARLLAGPKGYQDRDGKTWRYGSDGERVSPP